MNGITAINTSPLNNGVETKERVEAKPQSELKRVQANPFYPEGKISKATDSPEEVFQSNLPGNSPLEQRKIGTVLNTVA